MKNGTLKPPLLIYDQECSLCTRFAQIVMKWDTEKIIQLSGFQNLQIYEQFPELSLEMCQQKVHFIDQDKKIWAGGDVINQLGHLLPGIKKFAWLLDTDAGKKATAFFYEQLESLKKSSLNHCQSCSKNHTLE